MLVKAGLVHVQFETIHPFLDGNGRLGRLLIILLLCESGLLNEPILYLSLYFKENRDIYYRLLQEVRTNGTWEACLEFFLKGINEIARQAISTAKLLTKLFEEDLIKINSLGRAKFSCLKVYEYLQSLPQVTSSLLVKELHISHPTARSTLSHLSNLNITAEISEKKRGKIYVYKTYLDILEEGTKPFKE